MSPACYSAEEAEGQDCIGRILSQTDKAPCISARQRKGTGRSIGKEVDRYVYNVEKEGAKSSRAEASKELRRASLFEQTSKQDTPIANIEKTGISTVDAWVQILDCHCHRMGA